MRLFLHLCHFSVLKGQPARSRTYDLMRKMLYWIHIVNELYGAVHSCCSCLQNRALGRLQRRIIQSLTHNPFEYICMNGFAPLPGIKEGNHVLSSYWTGKPGWLNLYLRLEQSFQQQVALSWSTWWHNLLIWLSSDPISYFSLFRISLW